MAASSRQLKKGNLAYSIYLQADNSNLNDGKIPKRILKKLKPLKMRENPDVAKIQLDDKLTQAERRRQSYLNERKRRATILAPRKPLATMTIQTMREKQWRAEIRRQICEEEKMFRAAELSQSIWFSRSKERDPEEAKAILEERLKRAEIRRKMIERERLERIQMCEEKTKKIVHKMQPLVQQAINLESQRHVRVAQLQ